MELVGLTGGIGSGKSTVADRLRHLGCHVIDADQAAREVVEPGQPALREIAARFGGGILLADGRLDRPALAAIVFPDDTARADLERITHPRIRTRIAEETARIRSAGAAAARLVVVDHPLLVETGQAELFDAVVVVLAAEPVRIRRLVEGRGFTRQDARARLRAQADDAARRAVATHVIDNNGSLDDLYRQVDETHRQLMAASVDG